MIELTLITILFIQLIVVWIFLAFFYKDYRVDKLRQELFVIRDELFKFAERGEISFEDHAYGMTRSTLNGMIRFAHKISFSRLFFINILMKKETEIIGEEFKKKMDYFLSQLNEEARDRVKFSLFLMNFAVVRHLLFTSAITAPFMFMLIVIFFPFRVLFGLLKQIRKLNSKILDFGAIRKGLHQLIVEKTSSITISLDAEAHKEGINIQDNGAVIVSC